jgi:hypothetical protein
MRSKKMFGLMMILLFVVCFCVCESAFSGEIVAWGNNVVGQCEVPYGNDFIAVAGGACHNLALKSDGSLLAWGYNAFGQCDVPISNEFVAIAAGAIHSLVLKSDGSLVAWGYNGNGECDVPPGKNFIAIAAGYDHSLALRSDGSLVAWGDNSDGQCDVPAGNDFAAIAAGDGFSLALKSDGSLVAWERNLYGECDVPAGNDFVKIAAGKSHSLALKWDGSLVAWGANSDGQCNVPIGKVFVDIAAGACHNLALKVNSSVAAWGDNEYGQCDVPVSNEYVAVAAGSLHSLALTEPGGLLNDPPIADAGDDFVANSNEIVTLDGSASYDPDGQIILYTWKRLPEEVVIYSGAEPTCQTRVLWDRPREVIELTVTDNYWDTATDTVMILSRITHPIADAGDDLAADANEVVTLDASASYVPDAEIILYTWKRLPDEVVIYSGSEPICQTRALGRVEEVIELTVTDDCWTTARDTVRIDSRTTNNLKDQFTAMQSQIEQLQQQNQELRELVDKIASCPPIRRWLGGG